MVGRRKATVAVVLLGLGAAVGCMRPRETEDERIRRQAAESTRELRQDARTAGTMAREEARKAGQQARDIVAGVKEGWKDGAPPPASADSKGVLDINSATTAQLSTLPGVSMPLAKRIVHRRPYEATGDLVTRGVLTHAQLDRIASRVTVR